VLKPAAGADNNLASDLVVYDSRVGTARTGVQFGLTIQ
jgi:hypothetical protein